MIATRVRRGTRLIVSKAPLSKRQDSKLRRSPSKAAHLCKKASRLILPDRRNMPDRCKNLKMPPLLNHLPHCLAHPLHLRLGARARQATDHTRPCKVDTELLRMTASAIASSWPCVTWMNEIPSSRWSFFSSALTRSRKNGSSADSGSSRSKI